MQSDADSVDAARECNGDLGVGQALPGRKAQDLLIFVAEFVERLHHDCEIFVASITIVSFGCPSTCCLLQSCGEPIVATRSTMMIADQIAGDTKQVRTGCWRIRELVEATPCHGECLPEHILGMGGGRASTQAITPEIVVAVVIDDAKAVRPFIVHTNYMVPAAGTFHRTSQVSLAFSKVGRIVSATASGQGGQKTKAVHSLRGSNRRQEPRVLPQRLCHRAGWSNTGDEFDRCGS